MKVEIIFISLLVLTSIGLVDATSFGYGGIEDNSVTVTTLSGNLTNISQAGDVNIGGQADTQVLTWSAATSMWIAGASSGDNSSWNEQVADGKYAPIGSGNSSFNQSLTDGLYADITETLWSSNFSLHNDSWSSTFNSTYDALVTDNASWTEVVADGLYYGLDNPYSYYNSTSPPPGSNSSWNETHADTLYASILEPLWTNNFTSHNDSWSSTFNSTYDALVTDNSSWTEVVADTLYAPIAIVGTVTSVAAGNGLDFSTITSTGSITLGTPGTSTSSSTNAVSATSHTHEVDESGFSIAASQITAGTFGAGQYIFPTNVTVEKLVLENSAAHFIEDNSTCTKIYGSTSILEVC